MKNQKAFLEKWGIERKQGAVKYYFSHLPGMVFILLGILIGDAITRKDVYVDSIIAAIVAFTFPLISWFGNEIRYRYTKNV